MLRSLYSAISGLKNHQIKMDVIGNNIANVNTTGFKRSRVTFSTMLSQTLKGAGAPGENIGGTNAAQIGLGMMYTSIDQIMTTGSSQSTGKDTDVMIQGSGFFVLNNAGQTVYSRAGAFSQDSNGYLIEPGTGAFVMGYMWGADDSTEADFSQLSKLRFALGEIMPQTTELTLPNVPKEFPKDGWISSTVYRDKNLIGSYIDLDETFNDGINNVPIFPAGTIFDSRTGTITFTDASAAAEAVENIKNNPVDITHEATLTLKSFTAAGTDGWTDDLTYTNTKLIGATFSSLPTGVTFDSSTGTLTFANTTVRQSFFDDGSAGEAPVDVDVTVTFAPPTLTSFSIDSTGTITGVYSNGFIEATHKIGQLALANFANDAGLMNLGNSFYAASNNSGAARIGAAGTDGRGTIVPSAVEMSNVDLSQEFTDMIVTQRGFQANSRVITVSDSLLQELIDLKRG